MIGCGVLKIALSNIDGKLDHFGTKTWILKGVIGNYCRCDNYRASVRHHDNKITVTSSPPKRPKEV